MFAAELLKNASGWEQGESDTANWTKQHQGKVRKKMTMLFWHYISHRRTREDTQRCCWGRTDSGSLCVCKREKRESVCVCVCVCVCVKTITLAMHAMSDCWMNDYYEVLINQKYIESSVVQFSNKFILVNHKHTAWSVFQTNETVRAITNTKSFVILFWLLKVMSHITSL